MYEQANRISHLIATVPLKFFSYFFTILLLVEFLILVIRDSLRGEWSIDEWPILHNIPLSAIYSLNLVWILMWYFDCRTPYDRFTIFGYFIFSIHQAVLNISVLAPSAFCLSVFIGPNLFLRVFYKDLVLEFEKIRKFLEEKKYFLAKKKFIECVQFQSDIYR